MNRINVNQASREELIEIVKQLRQQLRSGQAAVQRIGELEEQVAAQQRELTAHNETIRALTQQNARLSEKSASDEETISALIQQLEGQWQQHSQLGGEGGAEGNVLVARAVKSPSPLALPQKGSTGAKGPPFTVPAKGGAVALGQVSDIGNGTAVNARKSDVTAQLEAKVREQTEIIAFYATALSQRDEEERRRAEAEAPATEAAEAAVAAASQRCRDAEKERDTLQHAARQLTQANATLEAELQRLREELTRMELDLVAAEQWREAQRDGAAAEAMPPLFHTEAAMTYALSSSPPPVRTLAQPVESSIQYRSSNNNNNNNGIAAVKGRVRTWSLANPFADTASLPSSHTVRHAEGPPRASLHRGLLDIGALPEIRLENPSRQEKLLLERLELFQRHVEDMQTHELDRQRSFDEIERTRAEFFTSMNDRLEAQRREIQQLKRRVAETHAQGPVQATTLETMFIATGKADVACSPIASLILSASETNVFPGELREETHWIRETAGGVPSATYVEERTETIHNDQEEQEEYTEEGKEDEEEEEEEKHQQGHDDEAELLRQLGSPPEGPTPPHDHTSEQLEREEECARFRLMSEAADIFAHVVARHALAISHSTATVIANTAKRAKDEAAERAEREAKAVQSFTIALERQERWEPLRCLCEAYGDVVDAQRALLHSVVRPIAVSDCVSPTAAEKRRQALAALDTALTRSETAARQSRNEHERDDDRTSSWKGSEASRETTPGEEEERTEAAEAAVETGEEWQWEEERGKEVKGRQAPSAQGQTESLPWWGTSGASLHAGAVAPGANSFPPKTKSSSGGGGGGNGNKEKMATMTTSDPIAMDPRQEAKDPFAFLATVAAPSGEASAVTTGLGTLDFFSTTAFVAEGKKPSGRAPSFVAEFDPFA